MKQTLTLLLLLPWWLSAQNLVVNPGFENTSQTLQNKGNINIAEGWSSPNIGSPELIGSNSERFVYDPYGSNWRFRPKSGRYVAGMNIFGSYGLDPDAQERAYIQGSLSRPLETGKKYYFSFWVHYHCKGTNNIGITFLPERLELSSSGQIDLMPAAWQHKVTPYSSRKTWTQVVDSFIAYQPYQYFVIGNFFSDLETDVQNSAGGHYFAYVDNVLVLEARNLTMPPVIATRGEGEDGNDWDENIRQLEKIKLSSMRVVEEVDLRTELPERKEVETIEQIFSSRVYFNLDGYFLDSEDKRILDKLATAMLANPDIRIMALGFTSSEGGNSYNLRLSDLRARAVRSYLVDQGIGAERVIMRALGEATAEGAESTESSRAQNRRVDFRMLW